jgi:glyoxylase-like metal-dependent hydrolase (beta-lactamase superfamily II)
VFEQNSLKAKYIILTHSHIDHILYVSDVRRETGAKVVMHKSDLAALTNPILNGAVLLGQNITFPEADIYVEDRDVLELGNLKLDILHTPGHTPGCICIKTGGVIFTGDTLFKLDIGRTDLANGNYEDIISSLKNKLMALEDDLLFTRGTMIQQLSGLNAERILQ